MGVEAWKALFSYSFDLYSTPPPYTHTSYLFMFTFLLTLFMLNGLSPEESPPWGHELITASLHFKELVTFWDWHDNNGAEGGNGFRFYSIYCPPLPLHFMTWLFPLKKGNKIILASLIPGQFFYYQFKW